MNRFPYSNIFLLPSNLSSSKFMSQFFYIYFYELLIKKKLKVINSHFFLYYENVIFFMLEYNQICIPK